jgi:hypothetical protein
MELDDVKFSDLAKFILDKELYLISPNFGVYHFQYKDKLYGFSVLGDKIKRPHTIVVDSQADDYGQYKVEKDFWDWGKSLLN